MPKKLCGFEASSLTMDQTLALEASLLKENAAEGLGSSHLGEGLKR